MQPLEFDRTSYLCDGKRIFLISGEIHYFRIAPGQWRDRLTRFRDAGGNCVGTYIPWLIHEPDEGHFTFDAPYHFEEFLQLCQQLGLWALVRPGPYQYSELIYSGLPGWLVENYPQLRARHIDGKPFEYASVSYLHPLFLQKARAWFERVIPPLAKYSVHRGGPVAAFQFDNECGGIHLWFGGWDYHPDAMGVGRDDGRWTRFLARRYGSLRDVCQAYEISATGFAQVLPIRREDARTPADYRRVKDYTDFYFASLGEYGQTLVSWMEELGVDVPIVHNSPNPESITYYTDAAKALAPRFILGADHYYNLDQAWPQNNPTPQYAARTFWSLETLRSLGVPPTVFELPGGSCADWPPITPRDAAACYMLNIALGMKGYNYYMFTGGQNPPQTGSTTDLYDYGAAIGPDGQVRPLYDVQKSLAEFLHENDWLTGASRVADCRIALSTEYARMRHYGGPGDVAYREPADFMLRGLLTTAMCGGFSPEMIEIDSDSIIERPNLPLLVPCATSMPREAQERLVELLNRGGRVLLAPVVPTLDERFQPCTILADHIGAAPSRKLSHLAPRLRAWDVENVFANGPLFEQQCIAADARAVASEVRTGRTVGWLRRLPAGGTICVLGLRWLHAKREHEAMLRSAMASLGCIPAVQCDNPNVWTSLRTDGKRSMLFVMNLLTDEQTARFRLTDPATARPVDTGPLSIPAMTVRTITP